MKPEMFPYPLNSPWVWGIVRRFGLPFWFLLTSIAQWIASAGPWRPGFDTELAVGASKTWLDGGNPWSYFLVGGDGNVYHFAGLPPTLFIYAPLTGLNLELAGYVGVAISLMAAVIVIRRLHLPTWWFLFPPLNAAIFFANPHMLLMALLLAGAAWLAPAVKVYAFVPMVVRRAGVTSTVGLAIFAATVLAAPTLWSNWATSFAAAIARLLAPEAQGGVVVRREAVAAGTSKEIGRAHRGVMAAAKRRLDRRLARGADAGGLWPRPIASTRR